MRTGLWWEDLRKRAHLEDVGAEGTMILERFFKKKNWGGGHGLDRAGSGEGQVTSDCERGNELSGSIKCGEFLD